MFLGQFSTKDWNDFDSQGNYKGSDPKMAEKIEAYKTRTSNVHGKYSAKDRRNFEYWELGKFLGQFKTWVPDWWKQRWGDRYIDRDGKEHYGSWRVVQYHGLKQMRKDFADPDFWGEYNVIEPDQSIESAIRRLARKVKFSDREN